MIGGVLLDDPLDFCFSGALSIPHVVLIVQHVLQHACHFLTSGFLKVSH